LTEPARPVACLGEAILDLVCERRLGPDDAPGPFEAHHGGAPANVAALLARSGIPTSLIGGLGEDRWGLWLRAGLESEGVDTAWLATVERVRTPVAVITFDLEGEPSFDVHGEDVGPAFEACSPDLERALDASGSLVIGGNTMVGETEREVTRRAVDLARQRGLPVLLDPNHRPGRWDCQEDAVRYSRELIERSDVVKANRAEAELLTGLDDPTDAAYALVELGATLVVITDGPGEIVARGAVEASFCPKPVEMISPLGAGDAFMAGLVAGLARGEWDLSRADELLPAASEEARLACLSWGPRP